jgi:hypothetical protein
VQENVLGHQLPIVQPQAITPGEIAFDGGKFQLQPAILVPGALNAGAMFHAIFAQQTPGFIPLAATTVQQAILIRFLVGEHPVLVPDEGHAVPASVLQRNGFPQLTIPVVGFFSVFFHKTDNRTIRNKTIQHKITKK